MIPVQQLQPGDKLFIRFDGPQKAIRELGESLSAAGIASLIGNLDCHILRPAPKPTLAKERIIQEKLERLITCPGIDPADPHPSNPLESSTVSITPRSKAEPIAVAAGSYLEDPGIYFFEDCAFSTKNGSGLFPDRDGIIWNQGIPYRIIGTLCVAEGEFQAARLNAADTPSIATTGKTETMRELMSAWGALPSSANRQSEIPNPQSSTPWHTQITCEWRGEGPAPAFNLGTETLATAQRPHDLTLDLLFDIFAERQRQVEAKGYDHAHDKTHKRGEIAAAAISHILLAYGHETEARRFWPFEESQFPEGKYRHTHLRKAAALLLADLERDALI